MTMTIKAGLALILLSLTAAAATNRPLYGVDVLTNMAPGSTVLTVDPRAYGNIGQVSPTNLGLATHAQVSAAVSAGVNTAIGTAASTAVQRINGEVSSLLSRGGPTTWNTDEGTDEANTTFLLPDGLGGNAIALKFYRDGTSGYVLVNTNFHLLPGTGADGDLWMLSDNVTGRGAWGSPHWVPLTNGFGWARGLILTDAAGNARSSLAPDNADYGALNLTNLFTGEWVRLWGVTPGPNNLATLNDVTNGQAVIVVSNVVIEVAGNTPKSAARLDQVTNMVVMLAPTNPPFFNSGTVKITNTLTVGGHQTNSGGLWLSGTNLHALAAQGSPNAVTNISDVVSNALSLLYSSNRTALLKQLSNGANVTITDYGTHLVISASLLGGTASLSDVTNVIESYVTPNATNINIAALSSLTNYAAGVSNLAYVLAAANTNHANANSNALYTTSSNVATAQVQSLAVLNTNGLGLNTTLKDGTNVWYDPVAGINTRWSLQYNPETNALALFYYDLGEVRRTNVVFPSLYQGLPQPRYAAIFGHDVLLPGGRAVSEVDLQTLRTNLSIWNSLSLITTNLVRTLEISGAGWTDANGVYTQSNPPTGTVFTNQTPGYAIVDTDYGGAGAASLYSGETLLYSRASGTWAIEGGDAPAPAESRDNLVLVSTNAVLTMSSANEPTLKDSSGALPEAGKVLAGKASGGTEWVVNQGSTNPVVIAPGSLVASNQISTPLLSATTANVTNFNVVTQEVSVLILATPLGAASGGTGTNTSGASVGQLLTWNGNHWVPSNAPAAGSSNLTTLAAGSATLGSLTVSNTLTVSTAAFDNAFFTNLNLQSVNVNNAAITNLQARGAVLLSNGDTDQSEGTQIVFSDDFYSNSYLHKISTAHSANSSWGWMRFALADGASAYKDVMTLMQDGSVGIGTNLPPVFFAIRENSSNATAFEIYQSTGVSIFKVDRYGQMTWGAGAYGTEYNEPMGGYALRSSGNFNLIAGPDGAHSLVVAAPVSQFTGRIVNTNLTTALRGPWEFYEDFNKADQINSVMPVSPTGHQLYRNGYGRETWGISNGVLSAWHEYYSTTTNLYAPRMGVLLSNVPTSINFELSMRAGAAEWTTTPGFCIAVSTNQLVSDDDTLDVDLNQMIHLNHYLTLASGGVNLVTNVLGSGSTDLTWSFYDSNSVDGVVWERPHTNEHFNVSLARVGTNTLRYTVKNYSVEFTHPHVAKLWGKSFYFQVYPNTGTNLLDRGINVHKVWAGYNPHEMGARLTRDIASTQPSGSLPADGTGMLTNNGSGTLGWMSIPSGGAASSNYTTIAAGSATLGSLRVTNALDVVTAYFNSATFTNLNVMQLQVTSNLTVTGAVVMPNIETGQILASGASGEITVSDVTMANLNGTFNLGVVTNAQLLYTSNQLAGMTGGGGTNLDAANIGWLLVTNGIVNLKDQIINTATGQVTVALNGAGKFTLYKTNATYDLVLVSSENTNIIAGDGVWVDCMNIGGQWVIRY